jgi:sugar/nucleoside kinase (ribokinase family)
MKLLVVGSVALDSVETPFGQVSDALGGSAVYFSVAASMLSAVRVIGVVGHDYPVPELDRLAARGIDWSGVERMPGESFRWRGKYSFDLSSRETLDTRLGVFAQFRPRLPAGWQETPFVFLGNIDPELQLGILRQMQSPRLVTADTMNYWIEGRRDRLMEVLGKVDILMLNDDEIRQLAEDWNVHRAARWVIARGPRRVVVKRGEHGALLVEPGRTFYMPAYPLEEVFDPTGAGDAFAGGFLGWLARSGDTSSDGLRRAMVYGAAMGSFAVQAFGVGGFEGVTPALLQERVRSFRDLTHVEMAEALA